MMLLIVQALIGMRAEIVQCRVATSAIVECFDVREKIGPSLIAGLISTVVHELAFNVAKKLSIGALSCQLPTLFILT